MVDITIKNLAKFYGGNKVLENISLEIYRGDKIGIIGDNGCGKTTLFKIITGTENYEDGTLHMRRNMSVGYLQQIPVYPSNFTVEDVLRSSFQKIYETLEKMSTLEKQMSQETDNMDRLLKEYSDLQAFIDSCDGYNTEEKINKICSGLKISSDMRNREFSCLSGGEKTIVHLGKLLLQDTDLLLLDEPTNHIDIEAVEWLENFLNEYKGTVLIISHDRYFLDKVVKKIIEIEDMNCSEFIGNYSYYQEEKKRRVEQQLAQYIQQQKKIKSMEAAIARFKLWGQIADDIRFFKKAFNMEKRIDKMDKVEKPNTNKKKADLSFSSSNRSGKEVLTVENLSKSIGKLKLYDNVNLKIFIKDRYVLVGKNGSGKSTFLKSIIRKFHPESIDSFYKEDNGTIKLGASIKMAYLPQEIKFPNEDKTVLQVFQDEFPIAEGLIRGILARYLFFTEDINKKVLTLSGGERSRLKMCILMQNKVNFLIMDEPTNHLDISSREMLESSLEEFDGTILFVSHDRFFINKISNKVLELKDCKITKFDYTYDEYKKILSSKASINKPKPKNDDSISNIKYQENKIISREQRKKENRLSFLENKISELELNISNINEEIELFSTDYDKVNKLYKNKEKLSSELEELLTEWTELQE
ncbi:ABC-F family ATP-binding cassette domain-containing protein [Oceanirhabdus seepicola]|uniref:ABC-F family ATP-binding cassette domain-containing protein n=1 Tax=Oceanirhabdus seepicola TaxID=2828781 RepID=A0A9J6P1E3_9CLOT|nr:ABC-F family ATP-binding cassette domain-containing protein [Oceanirhabdus seepicola]MCM1990355.1 ABC-F family ATP-binding cassette domain-containing protein [Oceanirhabdus seepicola]